MKIYISICLLMICLFSYGQTKDNHIKTISVIDNTTGKPVDKALVMFFKMETAQMDILKYDSVSNGTVTFNLDSFPRYHPNGARIWYVGMKTRIVDLIYEGMYDKDTMNVKMLGVDSVIKDYIRWEKPKE